MKWVLIVGGVVAALGLFLLATASGDTALLERQYPLLLALNAALAALLAGLVAYQLVAMALELSDRGEPQLPARLERLRAQVGVDEALVLTANGRLVASPSDDVTKL